MTTRFLPGPDGESLRCDPMPSSTYPDDPCSPEDYAWKRHKSTLLKLNSNRDGSAFKDSVHINNNNTINNNNNNSLCNKTCLGKPCDGHVPSVVAPMNTNGIDRKKMTGSSPTTSENLSWLSDVVASPAQSQRPGILAHEQSHVLSGSSGSIFRTPSITDPPAQRLFSPGHIAPVYTSASSINPYTPSMHSQSSHLATLSPYGAFYPQYSHAYAPGSLLSSHYPHIESYSHVLAAMGSHVQHAQTQLPRTPYSSGPLPQYHGTMTSTNSPGPSMHRQLGSSGGRSLSSSHISEHLRRDRDMKSPKIEKESESVRRHGRTLSPSSAQCLSSSQVSGIKSGHHKDSSSRDASSKDSMCMRPPASVGREGSLKQRILARPPDIHIEGEHRHTGVKFEEPPPKRHKSHSHPPPLQSSSASSSSHPSSLPPPPPLNPVPYPNTPHYPPHFMKGSIIQLANGELKRVEDLRTDDFVNSADVSSDLKIDSSTVVRIEELTDRSTALLSFSVGEHRVQVTVEATLEHPFFVFGQGWSSCQPQRTQQRYGLTCHKLSVGDVCISLTHKEASSKAAELSRQQQLSSGKGRNGASKSQVLRQQSSEAGVRTATSQQQQQQQLEPGQVRKRRWSAPDQISLDTAKQSPPPQSEPSQQPSPSTSTKSDSQAVLQLPTSTMTTSMTLSPGSMRTTPPTESTSPRPSSRMSTGASASGEKT
ncbi:uncharacterized protein LOC141901473 isoform X2 [Tubulanus polymorphus]|uniref:uncharacterized protein LOC141901473 isoform X2 n=1 Tax=Tubulanus polymorphus TaxID=672921 RepID=UPI003DA57D5E